MLGLTNEGVEDVVGEAPARTGVISNPVLRACLFRALDLLRGALNDVFDAADESLFDAAETAERLDQVRYFEVRRKLRKDRRAIQGEFRACVQAGFVRLSRNQPLERIADSPGDDDCHETDLRLLGRRLAVLVGKPDLPRHENPLSPANLGACFAKVCEPLSASSDIRITLQDHFREHVIARLEGVYPALNAYLAGEGVLPGLQSTLEGSRAVPRGIAAGDTGPAEGTGDEEGEADAGGAASVSGNDQGPAGRLADASKHPAGPSPRHRVDALFRYIDQDRNLPGPVRALLTRLQPVYERLACVDDALFEDDAHPARRLLNTLAALGIGWSRSSDPDGKLLAEIEAVIGTVENDPHASCNVLESALEQLQKTTIFEERAAVANQQAMGTAQGHERLETARQAAHDAISKRLSGCSIPDFIKELISTPWANVLVLHHLRHGPGSREWEQALSLIDDLIWTGQPKLTAADVARLQSMLPAISERLRRGLEMVAFNSQDLEEVFAELKETYRALLSDAYREKLHMPSVRSVTPLRPIRHLHPVDLRAEDDKAPDARTRIPQRIRAQVENLAAGTWLEFTDPTGNPIRAKLSWITPKQRYLFVSEKGIKITDKSADELAQEITTGETLILDSTPVFDRAMSAMDRK